MSDGSGKRLDPAGSQDINIALTQNGQRGLDALPHELINLVFAYTSYHKATIVACTLVSRSWRALSAPHLFSSLTVVRRASFADFEEFLDEHPHIAGCIRQLDLKHAVSPRVAMTYAALARLSKKLPGLQVLRLRRLWLLDLDSGPSSNSTTISTTSRSRLKSLVLNECFTHNNALPSLAMGTLHSIFDMFPADSISLRYLTVAAIPKLSPGPGPQNQWNQLETHTLTVQHVHAQYLLPTDALPARPAAQCLHSFQARPTPGPHMQNGEPLYVLSELLRCIGGERLRYLEIPLIMGPQLCPLENKPGYGCVLHLNARCNPESFTFQLHVPLPRTFSEPTIRRTEGHYIRDVPLSAVMVAYLPRLPSTIRTYTLRFLDAHSPAHLEKTDLERLDGALLERFPSLATLRVVFPDTASLRQYTQAVIRGMPKCGQQRLVSIVEWTEMQDLADW